jgi:HK97 family phage major capsid protein
MIQLIERAQEALATKLAARNAIAASLSALREQDAPDEARVEQLRADKAAADAEIDILQARVASLRAEKLSDDAVDSLSRETTPGAPATNRGTGWENQTRTTEARTYTRESFAHNNVSFFADAYRAQFKSDYRASERLQRHMKEVEVEERAVLERLGREERATTTGSFAGLVIPQYLPELAALALRNGRPVANVVRHMQLPAQGLSIVIQRATTGVSAAVQATENTAVSSTDEVWADLTIPVRTIAGQQDVSRQSLERGYSVDELIYLDLAKAYAAALDTQVINGSGSSGQMLGILNTAGIGAATAFGAAPGPANFNLKVAGANTAVYSAGQGLGPDILVMHPRRWGWLTGLVDSTNRPIVTANTLNNFNAIGVGTIGGDAFADASTPIAGVHSSGLPVLLDLNIPTTVGTNSEDIVLSLDSDELILWEDGDGMPRQLSFEQTTGGSLTTKLVVYGYAAFTAGRYPAASAKVGGLDSTATFGLVAPTF